MERKVLDPTAQKASEQKFIKSYPPKTMWKVDVSLSRRALPVCVRPWENRLLRVVLCRPHTYTQNARKIKPDMVALPVTPALRRQLPGAH